MKIFLSWSGNRSKEVADLLKVWLKDMIHEVSPWMSDKDIAPGTKWSEVLSKELEESSFGIICLTPENSSSPWLMFEAGALSKAVNSSRVIPYCIGLDPLQVQQPLSQFQSVRADKDGTLRIVRCINELLTNRLPEDRLIKSFDRWWPDLEKAFSQMPAEVLPTSLERVHVKNVYVAYTPEFEQLKPDGDINLLEDCFPNKVQVHRNISKLQFEEALSGGQFEIVHILGRVDAVKGDLYFRHSSKQSVKLDALLKLIEACKARLVFLATCDSTVLASRLSRIATVIAAYGSVNADAMIEWEQTFYKLLVKGRKLTEAFDIAQASSDVPMTIHLKNDMVLLSNT